MSTYRVEWPCCGSVTETDAWEPERCPFCTIDPQDATTIATLRAEIAKLKTVMVAAAEEIDAHWEAHCDSEGYGPQNLMRRLEEGIPAQYGYTAGAFATLRAELEAMRRDAERLDWLDGTIFMSRWNGVLGDGSQTTWTIAADWRHIVYRMTGDNFRAALDAAITKEHS